MAMELESMESDDGIVFLASCEAAPNLSKSETQPAVDVYYSLSDYTASDNTQVSLRLS